MEKLKFSNYDIVFQEVPGEVTLAINITGCPHRCHGCHSAYLQEYFGESLLENLDSIISKYDGLISCVGFMGGDQNIDDLKNALNVVKARSLKTCVYSGLSSPSAFDEVLPILDYLKIGQYKEECGGLNSSSTNQKFYTINNCDLLDKTYLFKPKTL